MRTSSTLTSVFATLALLACSAERAQTLTPATAADAPLVHSTFPPAGAESASATARRPGDFYVHEISGSFRKHPAILTERVVAREGDTWIIDYRLEDSDGAKSIRVRLDENGEVSRVSKLLEGGAEQPGTLADYEAMMASASLAPDENEGLTATTRGTCTVGPSELDCETKSYRVLLGDREANLGITESASLPGRDLAGEITASDGTVIYRSVLVEHGNEASHENDSLAMHLPPL
ncbi:MAG TPA: hypothetical protein VGQ57_08630 [Polyangiaceae bacterium]|jgi:hypothetical protein|nr:hypothetical protein [Polyangiaceae bacterium]